MTFTELLALMVIVLLIVLSFVGHPWKVAPALAPEWGNTPDEH